MGKSEGDDDDFSVLFVLQWVFDCFVCWLEGRGWKEQYADPLLIF